MDKIQTNFDLLNEKTETEKMRLTDLKNNFQNPLKQYTDKVTSRVLPKIFTSTSNNCCKWKYKPQVVQLIS